MHWYSILNCSLISIEEQKFSRNSFTCAFTTLGFLSRMKRSVIGFGRVMNNNVELCSDWLFHSAAQCWALLWLAVSQCGSMLSSALIGCFTVRLNVELCSDWLFHSAAQCWALLWLAVSQCGSMLRRLVLLESHQNERIVQDRPITTGSS